MISAIIPVFNTQHTIEKMINSLLKQTINVNKLELFLVDDGSTDYSGNICDECAKTHSNVFVIHTANNGVSAARNVGIRAAHGEYIAFIDSDDWVEPNMFEVLLNAIESTEADLVACGVIHETKYGSFPDAENDDKLETFEGAACYDAILHYKGIRGYLCNKLFRKELITKEIDESLAQCEDLVFIAEYLECANKVSYIRTPLYHYVRKNGSNDFTYSQRQLSLMDAYEKIFRLYKQFAPESAIITEKNLLKIYLNYRARYLLCEDTDEQLRKKIYNGVYEHMRNVVFSPKVAVSTKGNILASFFFPRTMLRAKNQVKKMRHASGLLRLGIVFLFLLFQMYEVHHSADLSPFRWIWSRGGSYYG